VAVAVVHVFVVVVVGVLAVVVPVIRVATIVAPEVLPQPLAVRDIRRCLRRPLPIEKFLGLSAWLHSQQAAEAEPPPGRGTTVRADHAVSDRGRGEDLVCRSATIAAIVDK
jgi:hypothetical protein